MRGMLSTIFIIAAIVVFLTALVAWRKDDDEPHASGTPQRIGYLGREGSKGDLHQAKFGKDLDTAIDNAGEIDASEAQFE